MPSTRKKKSSFANQEKHTLEFTPAQLIGAICTLMVFGLLCFLLGVVVNKFDSAHAEKRAVAVARDEEPQPATPVREGKQTTPRLDVVKIPSSTSSTPPKNNPATSTVPRKDDTIRPVPLPPAKESPAKEASKEPTQVATASPVKSVELPPMGPTATPGPAPAKSETPVAPSPAKPETAVAPKPAAEVSAPEPKAAPSAAPPSNETLSPEKDNYAIQVAAYSPSNRAKAEQFRALLEKQLKMTARLVTSKDGKWIRVMVGSFPDAASAQSKQAEMKQIKQFKDCMVKALK